MSGDGCESLEREGFTEALSPSGATDVTCAASSFFTGRAVLPFPESPQATSPNRAAANNPPATRTDTGQELCLRNEDVVLTTRGAVVGSSSGTALRSGLGVAREGA